MMFLTLPWSRRNKLNVAAKVFKHFGAGYIVIYRKTLS